MPGVVFSRYYVAGLEGAGKQQAQRSFVSARDCKGFLDMHEGEELVNNEASPRPTKGEAGGTEAAHETLMGTPLQSGHHVGITLSGAGDTPGSHHKPWEQTAMPSSASRKREETAGIGGMHERKGSGGAAGRGHHRRGSSTDSARRAAAEQILKVSTVCVLNAVFPFLQTPLFSSPEPHFKPLI